MEYQVWLADPPWPFDVWGKNTGSSSAAETHYPTMTVEEICDLPVQQYMAKDAVLFLWVVSPSLLDYPKRVLDAWGFTYKTLAWPWIKLNTSGVGWHVGMGYYTRANTELCLLATKGRMPVATRAEKALLIEYEDQLFGLPLLTPMGEHSEKPVEQYAKIERLYPAAKYPNRIELFARKRRPVWHAWGNEVISDIVLNPIDTKREEGIADGHSS